MKKKPKQRWEVSPERPSLSNVRDKVRKSKPHWFAGRMLRRIGSPYRSNGARQGDISVVSTTRDYYTTLSATNARSGAKGGSQWRAKLRFHGAGIDT